VEGKKPVLINPLLYVEGKKPVLINSFVKCGR